MEKYSFSNKDIDLSCERVGAFLSSSDIDKRELLRIKLMLEEVLLKYQEKKSEDSEYKIKCSKLFSSIKIEAVIPGEPYDPFENEDEDNLLVQGLLAGIGLAPTWNYKNGRNYIVFIPKKKPVSQTVKMLIAIAASVIVGILLTFLPDSIRIGTSEYLLTPITNKFMGLISAVSGPLIFLSVLGSICSMGDMETLGKIGKKTSSVIFKYMTVISFIITFIGVQFYKIESGSSSGSNFSQVLDLIYDIIPSNFFEPFLTGNALQLIFIAVITGIAMLMLTSKVSLIFSIINQLSSIIQTIMGGLSSLLPAAVFIIFTNMIVSGNLKTLFSSWKIIAVILLLLGIYIAGILLWTSARKKVSPILLAKKAFPTFFTALTTASSSATFPVTTRDAHKNFGIDKKLVSFGIPLGQVLYMPGFIALMCMLELGFADAHNIPITFSWLVLGYITNLLLSFAIPPVPGGCLMAFTIIFTQLGIPMEAMGIAIAINTITDFPATAINTTGWQLTLIHVADSLNMLNEETLRKELKTPQKSSK